MSEISDWDTAMKSIEGGKRGRRKNLTCGCGIFLLIVVLVACIFGSGIVFGILEGTWFVPGDPTKFDPITAFDEIQNFAGDDTRFVEMTARYVQSAGTLDLHADYRPDVDYVFVRLADDQSNNVPIGAPGYRGDTAQYEYVTVEISAPFTSVSRMTNGSSSSYVDLGMSRLTRNVSSPERLPEEAVPPPQCSTADLWKIANTYDAPSNAVAIITYDQDGYTFTIHDVNIELKFSHDCVVMRS